MSKKNRVFSRSQSKQFFSMKLTWTPPYKNNFTFVILNYFYKGGPYSLPTPLLTVDFVHYLYLKETFSI